MSKTLLKDSDGTILHQAIGDPADPRLIVITDEEFMALGELYDRRGAPRWKYNDVSEVIELIPCAERVTSVEQQFAAWLAWIDLQSKKDADPDLQNNVALAAYVDNQIAILQARFEELTRTGCTTDD